MSLQMTSEAHGSKIWGNRHGFSKTWVVACVALPKIRRGSPERLPWLHALLLLHELALDMNTKVGRHNHSITLRFDVHPNRHVRSPIALFE